MTLLQPAKTREHVFTSSEEELTSEVEKKLCKHKIAKQKVVASGDTPEEEVKKVLSGIKENIGGTRVFLTILHCNALYFFIRRSQDNLGVMWNKLCSLWSSLCSTEARNLLLDLKLFWHSEFSSQTLNSAFVWCNAAETMGCGTYNPSMAR